MKYHTKQGMQKRQENEKTRNSLYYKELACHLNSLKHLARKLLSNNGSLEVVL
jgi:hypothetical protein